MQLLMLREINTMERKPPLMSGNPKYNSQMSSVCLRCGYWEVLLVKTLTVLKLVGRYSYGLLLITQFLV